jgi:DNA-binding transcriptional MerR regulator
MIQTGQKILSTSEILKILGIPMYKLRYLFQVGKLRDDDFIKLGNGHKVYRESDIPKIKAALFEITNK